VDPKARRRAVVLAGASFILLAALLARVYAIQISGHEGYRARRDAQVRGLVNLECAGGTLRDAGGHLLSVSVPVESVWANPSALADRASAARLLAGPLGLREAAVRERLERADRKFVWVKRKVTPGEAAAVRALLPRPEFRANRATPEAKLGLVTEFARRYPFGPLLSQTLGFAGEDEGSAEGLHRSLETTLRGGRRTLPVEKDGRQRIVDLPDLEPLPAEVTLTVPLLFQKIVEEELDAACAEFRPRWAVAVAMEPSTGAILAVVNRPTFDPNRPGDAPGDARRNRAIVDPYEPGSTLKPFLAAYALDLGLVTPDTRFDCENGLWKHGPRLLHDHHPYGTIPLLDVIKFSSNIGAAKLGALTLGRARLYECMRSWGFGARTGIDLPAEDDGRLFPLSRWTVYSETSVPMGHEIAVTPLQLVTAMSAIANGGTLYRPFVVRRVVAGDGSVLAENGPEKVRRVIGEKAASQAREMLKAVVREGTGKKAQVPGLEVAGKTGTTQKVDPATRRYTHERYISSFVGFAPADAPKVCVAVVLDEPHGAYYGGAVAAPAVGRIFQRGLIHLK
jgi:cell division protein FtsI (penicillin-binding protein 3)